MKIQFLNGGLANQTFQYIFTRYYALSHPGQTMYLDDSYFALNTVHNGYEIEKVFPNSKPALLSSCFDQDIWEYMLAERRKGKSIPQILTDNQIPTTMVSEFRDSYKNFNPFDGDVICVNSNSFEPEILDYTQENIYYHGYWINKHWLYSYRDTMLKELELPPVTEPHNIAYLNEINNSNSVSVHIRRGDYVKLDWSLSIDDIRKIIDGFVDSMPGDMKLHAFVFSDDIPWCQSNYKGMGLGRFSQCTFVEGNTAGNNYRDLQLMSNCRGMIMSNSAFCYLAALLNQKKEFWSNVFQREV